ncbi:MAG TPA: DPP IV N-terminal domain-containing protein [Thermomicrobiales bacterium]|nr:DPP IV N-terminal domain-containing protein [Thermomicrobiales bacterium]
MSRRPRRRPPAAPCALLALALLATVALAACTSFGRQQRVLVGPEPTATRSGRSRATPVPTIGGPPEPTPIAPITHLVPSQTLAFVSDRGGQIDLWLTDIVTGQLWRLTDDKAVESFPAWSPDGTMLAYVVEDQHQERNLWILDLATGERHQLTHEKDPFDVRRAAWLAGGHALIYDTGQPFDRRPELRVVTLDGATLAPLTPPSGSVIFDWATDGATLVAAVGPPLGEPRLVVADAVPGARLNPDPALPVGFGVALSPDGRYVTYQAPPLSDNQTTWVLDLDTGDRLPLNEDAPGRRYEHDFAWSPSGRLLAYVHGVGGVTDGIGRLKVTDSPPPTTDPLVGIWMVDRTGQGRDWLTTGSTDAAPVWSPDGRWLAYLSAGVEPLTSNIWLLAVDPLYRRQLNLTAGRGAPGDNGNNWSPTWMPLAGEGPGGR